jgi:hypothetical protein
MDWLRSEDLKEEKTVTAPTVIVAVIAVCRCYEWRGVPLDMSGICPEFPGSFFPNHSVAADILVREEPDEEEEDEDDGKDKDYDDDDEENDGYSE